MPRWYDPEERMRVLVFTLVTSPDFSIQK